MASWSNGHTGGGRFTNPVYLGFWAAAQGPWKLVHEEELWLSESHYDYGARCCPPQSRPKWVSADDRGFA